MPEEVMVSFHLPAIGPASDPGDIAGASGAAATSGAAVVSLAGAGEGLHAASPRAAMAAVMRSFMHASLKDPPSP